MKDTFLEFTTLNWREMKGNMLTLVKNRKERKRETERSAATFDKHSEIQ